MGGHGKAHNKSYMTAKEWAEAYGGHKGDRIVQKARVPFTDCALSLQPFTTPVLAPDGSIFDILCAGLLREGSHQFRNIVPFVKKYKKNPVNGEAMTLKDLVRLNFAKNANGIVFSRSFLRLLLYGIL